MALSLVVMKPTDWATNKLKFFQRVILTAHARTVNNGPDKHKYIITIRYSKKEKIKYFIKYFSFYSDSIQQIYLVLRNTNQQYCTLV